MKFRICLQLIAALLGLLQFGARAEDIDLFTGSSSSSTAASNLLIIIDNAADFSANTTISGSSCIIGGATNSLSGTVGGVEQCVLHSVISSLTVTSSATLNVGIMLYNASNVVTYTGGSCPSSGLGGCLVYPLTGLTTATKTTLLDYIVAWKTSNGGDGSRWVKANGESTAQTLQEAWAYYVGRTGLSGTNYSSSAPSTNCKNFIMFLANATSNNTTPGDTGSASPKAALEGTLTGASSNMNAYPAATTAQKTIITNTAADQVTACGTETSVPTSTHENAGYYADEWARYMKANSPYITTYSVALVKPGSCKTDVPWLMASMASYGGGKYFSATTGTELNTAISTIFSEVRSVNSVFAAVSLPVSVNTQGTYLNQVFIGMFRPDADSFPRWYGNLKQYRMGYLNGSFRMLDADGAAAISGSGSEFIGSCARSYWTPTATATGDGYWSTYTDSNCTGYPASSNSPDGNLVEKGGEAYMLRQITPTNRTIKTCSSTFASCTTLTDFTTTNAALTTALFGVPDATTLSTVINWARGTNNHVPGEDASINGASITNASMRPSSHGDVVHSRPAALNFGTDASPKVVVFYGGNDGVFRAINGNRTASFTANSATVTAGSEFWGFMPPEFYGKVYRLYQNITGISSANPKDYAMDGPITAYKTSSGDGYIFAGMRRGGRALYAFQMSSSTLTMSLLWKRGCGDYTTTNCSNDTTKGDWRNIGQTWAPPQVFTAQFTGTTPMLIFGGGYDATCEDPTAYPTCASPIGNRVYVATASTGNITATFTTDRGVVGDVTIYPDSSGNASYIWLGDLGGNIYRISGPLVAGAYTAIGNNAPSTWVMTKIASVGCATITTCTSPPNRKFMFSPEVVYDSGTYWILIGSGDREKPTNTSNATTNYFFAIKDRPDQGSTYLTDTASCGASTTTLCLASFLSITKGTTPDQTSLDAKKGWYLGLDTNEQVVNAAVAIYGTVYFNTHTPQATAANSCQVNLGTLRNYAVAYTNSSGNNSPVVRSDGGLAPDPVAGKVTLDSDQGGGTVGFCIGCVGPLEASQPPAPSANTNPAKVRSYWYIQK